MESVLVCRGPMIGLQLPYGFLHRLQGHHLPRNASGKLQAGRFAAKDIVRFFAEAVPAAAPAETAAGAQPCSEPSNIALRPEHSGMANQKQQASSSSQQPNGRSSHETGKHVRSSDKAGSKAEFLTFTDTVLRFREAT